MDIIITKSKDEFDNKAAQIVAHRIANNHASVLGLATGSTPEGLYSKLIQMNKNGQIDFKDVQTFNLDEYQGLSKDHPQSYCYFMHEHLFDKINIDRNNIHLLDGKARDLEKECSDYEDKIKAVGGIDLQIVGIGHNAHIGFNEPSTPFGSTTSLIQLTEATIEINSRYFESVDEVPRWALSMGLKTIMQAREIVFMACGKDKAQAVVDALKGPITTLVPGSVLQLHPYMTAILDEDAASML